MIKNLFLVPTLMLSALVFSQGELPTVVSYEVDTICELDYGFGVYDLVIEDLDGDSTYLEVTNVDPAFISWTWVYEPAVYVPGALQRVFKIEVSANGALPPGVSLSDIEIEIHDGINIVTATLNNIGVRKGPEVTTDFSTAVFCNNGNPIDPAPYVNPDGGNIIYADGTVSSVFDPEIYYADPGDGIVYEYTDAYGCSDDNMEWITVVNAPDVSVIANSSSCGNADGSAIASIIGDIPDFDVYWTTGFSENVTSSSIVNNLSSGTYYVNVVDANGCKAVGIAQISDGDFDITETITQETCGSLTFDGAIDLDILSTNGTVDYIFWSNGETTEDISNLKMGDYTVHVHSTSNCNAYMTFTVGAPAPLGVTVDNIMPADCFAPDGAGNSGIQITTFGGSGTYNWQWSHGPTTEDVAGMTAGIYTCTVTDAVTGCEWSWTKDLEDINGPYIAIDEVLQSDCNQPNGAVDAYVWSAAAIISTSWDNGHLTEDLTNVPAGTYELTVTDINGCSTKKLATVPSKKPYQPSICLLTVDTSLIYNQVVWEKDITQDIAGFNVYRETSEFGVFEQVATRPYGLESFFQDNIASPVDRSWRYYITTYDDCGVESFPSFVHKTIHVVSNTSDGVNYDLSWDDYEGITYSTVDLYRFDETNGWMNIANLPFGTHTYDDMPPVITGLDYMVSFNLADPCTSTKAQDHNSSRSNKTAGVFMPGGSTAVITDEELGYISIYPNPASDLVTLHVDKPELFQSYEITTLNGDIVASGIIYVNNTNIPTAELASGVYMIRLFSAEKIIVEKLIKN